MRGYSGFTLIFSVLAALLFGVSMGVGLMLLLRPSSSTSASADAGADASASATAEASATASASASSSSDAPTVDPGVNDPAAAARAAKLAALRKKVKATRSSQLDAQCKKLKPATPSGYIYSGGTYSENEFVANASGCVALAKTSKAPWFCCHKR
jgi:hypothetical protein